MDPTHLWGICSLQTTFSLRWNVIDIVRYTHGVCVHAGNQHYRWATQLNTVNMQRISCIMMINRRTWKYIILKLTYEGFKHNMLFIINYNVYIIYISDVNNIDQKKLSRVFNSSISISICTSYMSSCQTNCFILFILELMNIINCLQYIL